MKILFYIYSIAHEGGAERVMTIIANALSHNNEVILVNDFPCYENEYSLETKIQRFYLADNNNGNHIIKNIKRIRKLRSILKKNKPDVSISFLFMQNIRLILASSGLHLKTILSVRNDPVAEFGNKGIKRTFINKIYNKSDGIVFQTKEELEYFTSLKKPYKAIILNPLKDIFFEIKRNSKTENLITFGRLENQKNHLMMIDAFNEIHKFFPDERLYIYGEGYLRKQLQDYIESLDLSDFVLLPGRVTDVSSKLADAKLFLLSSNYEGLPNAIMEAMAAGVPVVSTDCSGGGPRMLIEDGINGRLVECNNVKQMSEAIKDCLQDEELLTNFSDNSKKKAENFRTERIIKEWENFINKIVQHRTVK